MCRFLGNACVEPVGAKDHFIAQLGDWAEHGIIFRIRTNKCGFYGMGIGRLLEELYTSSSYFRSTKKIHDESDNREN